jgi:spermidine/putrescine transport system substrate-binding protein
MRIRQILSVGYLTISVLVIALFSASSLQAAESTKELNIWTWGIYCPDFATKSFEEKYGIKVKCTFYHGNEELWSKVMAGHGGVDIIQPSHNMIKRFAKASLLDPIDFSKIPNYEYVFPSFKNGDYSMFEGKSYSVPYTFGVNGMCYRTDMIKDPVTSLGALWDKRYAGHITVSRNPDDATELVALYLHMDVSKLNEDTDAKLEKIKKAMREQNPLLLKRFESLEEEKNLLASGEAWVASSDDGNAWKMMIDQLPIQYVLPEEGATAWIDQFAIMADAPHKDNAYLWINHMLSPEMASMMIQKIGYMVVNEKAQDALPEKLKKIMVYTPEQMKRVYPMPTLLPETTQKIVSAYQDVRGQ